MKWLANLLSPRHTVGTVAEELRECVNQNIVAVIDRCGDQQDVNFYREMEDGSLVEVPWPCGVPSWGVSEGRLRELGYRVVRT